MPAAIPKPKTSAGLIQRATDWAVRHPFLFIGLLLLACEGPFLDKAVHIDDALFMWTAEQIQHHPGNFYGFDVNWVGRTIPMAVENCNPPATAYLFAGVAAVLGWREIYLHAAMLLVTFAAASGTFQLARQWCAHPLSATLLAISLPAFMVSATTLMCDLPMLALWLWCLVCWQRGLQRDQTIYYLAAGLLGGLAVLTKYSAITLLPLLPIMGFLEKRKAGWWLVWLLVPILIIEWYQWMTARLYGIGLITAASNYAAQTRFRVTGGWFNKVLIGIAYAGGCLLPVLFFLPKLFTKRALQTGGILGLSAAMALIGLSGVAAPGGSGLTVQMGLMLATGFLILLLIARALCRWRDPVTVTLGLWLGGTFVFASVLNWTVSARSFLPMVPAMAILVVRELRPDSQTSSSPHSYFWPLIAALILSFVVSWSDLQLANSGREAANALGQKYAPGNRLWFQGHRGFQYYLQRWGARPVDFETSLLQSGDLMIIPYNGNTLEWPDDADARLIATHEFPACEWLSTVQAVTGAGFYGAGGLAPFVFGPVPVEKYFVFQILRPLSFAPPESLNNQAWQLATSSDPGQRDGTRAVQLAERACTLTNYKRTVFLGTLGAAYAEAGRFPDAIDAAKKACASAIAGEETALLQRNQELLALYQSHRPYHEPAEKLVPAAP